MQSQAQVMIASQTCLLCHICNVQDYFFHKEGTHNGGNRYATVLTYLNDVEEGGETVSSAPQADVLCSVRMNYSPACTAALGIMEDWIPDNCRTVELCKPCCIASLLVCIVQVPGARTRPYYGSCTW